jgi:hypothetical protein
MVRSFEPVRTNYRKAIVAGSSKHHRGATRPLATRSRLGIADGRAFQVILLWLSTAAVCESGAGSARAAHRRCFRSGVRVPPESLAVPAEGRPVGDLACGARRELL